MDFYTNCISILIEYMRKHNKLLCVFEYDALANINILIEKLFDE